MADSPINHERIELSHKLAMAILKAVGADASNVIAVNLDMAAGKPAVLTVKRCIPAERSMELPLQILERSVLAPMPDPEAFGLPTSPTCLFPVDGGAHD